MRSGWALLVAVAALGGVGGAWGTGPPRQAATSVDIWGQPGRAQEVADRPLGATLALFRDGAAVRLPPPGGLMRPLPVVAAGLRGDPGALEVSRARRVVTPAGPVYLVPTRNGWACVQGPTFETCHRGLLRQGVTWSFYSTSTGLDVIGIAANDVRAVTLRWGTSSRRARLGRNVFFVHRPLSIASAKHIPPLGRLVVAYRGTKRPATALLR